MEDSGKRRFAELGVSEARRTIVLQAAQGATWQLYTNWYTMLSWR